MASAPPEPVVNNEDAEFDKAFNEFAAGGTPAPVEEAPDPDPLPEGNAPSSEPAPDPAPAEEDESGTSGSPPAPDPAPAADDVPDPWANFPDEAKAELAALKKERDDALHRAKSDAERVKGLARKLSSFTNAGSAPQAAPPAAEPEASEAQKALDAKIKQLKQDYPEVSEPLIEMLEAQRKELNAVRDVIGRVSAERDQAMIEAERQTLAERHPDFEQVAQDPQFGEWLQAQPANIQRLATSWDARETSVALTLFKTERAEAAGHGATAAAPAAAEDDGAKAATDARRKQQLDGGRDVRSRPASAASGPPEDFDAAFEHFAKLQLAKKQQQQSVR